MSYTLGPWNTTMDDNGDICIIPVPSLWDAVEDAGMYFDIAKLEFDPEINNLVNMEANARLIAAAPEMWELMLDLYNDMDVEIPSKYLDRLTDIRTKVEEGETFGD